jgi:hypothetical protein
VTVALAALCLLVAIVALGAWCAWTATRLDRLQVRCEAAEAAVRTHLLRRSSVAVELATTRVAEPRSSALLLDAAARARDARGDEAWMAESGLTHAVRLVGLPPADSEPLVALLDDAQRRAAVARRIHNDTAASALDLRARRRVRWLRLAGRSRPPTMIEFDDGS